MYDKNDELEQVVNAKIEQLRPRLLDLSRRNPLISTPLDSRRGSYVRVVDELPDELFIRLSKGERLRFAALPDFEDEPADEQTDQFQEELHLAMANDEVYAAAIDDINPGDDDAPVKEIAAERQLRDRLRERLGMPDRGTRDNPKLQEHAKSFGISPHYDLPAPENEHTDGRHNDDEIQTLLLPEIMERTLNRIRTKCRTFQQETGLNVMQAAFGYLDWSDPESKKRCYSPLILVPVELTKTNSPRGTRFHVTGSGEEALLNMVLEEKLRGEYGVQLPTYDGGSIEDYLEEVTRQLPRSLSPQVRRFVTFGAFPSAQLAMFHDLDTQLRDFAANDVVRHILGGSDDAQGLNLFAEEYHTDAPEIESQVPLLVTDADSSQFSALVDIASGKSLAVEGPPGTGKSQTIVNAIAAAMLQGKKVLFVAEKTAALDVVKSRLDHLGLGPFVLPLTASGASRQQVLASVAERLDLVVDDKPSTREPHLEEFRRVRQRLADYIALMRSDVAGTGHTVHDVLGRALRLEVNLRDIALPEVEADSVDHLAASRITEILSLAAQLVDAHTHAFSRPSGWSGVHGNPLDRFTTDEALRSAGDIAKLSGEAARLRDTLAEYGAPYEASPDDSRWLDETLVSLLKCADRTDTAFAIWIARHDASTEIRELLAQCESLRSMCGRLATRLVAPFDADLRQQLRTVLAVCESTGMETLDRASLESHIAQQTAILSNGENALRLLTTLVSHVPGLADCGLTAVAAAATLIRQTPRDALLLRRPDMADPRATRTLQSGVEHLRRLRQRRAELDVRFDVMRLPDADMLGHEAEILAKAGMFSGLSSGYRRAKRRWLDLRRQTDAFKRADAARDLKLLTDWRRDATAFADDRELKALLASDFTGVDTDLSIIESLTTYLAGVENQFAALDSRSLRSLLHNGEIDVLASLAQVELDGFPGSVTDLDSELRLRREKLRLLEAGLQQILALHPRLTNPNATSPHQLLELRDILDSYDSGLRAIAEHPLREPLGRRWCDEQLRHEDLAAELDFAELISRRPDWINFYCTVIEHRDLDKIARLVKADTAPAVFAKMRGLTDLVELPSRPKDELVVYAELTQQFEHMANDRSGLVQHAQAHTCSERVRAFGFGAELDAILEHELGIDRLPGVIEARIYRSLARWVHDQHGEILAAFRHDGLDKLRRRLATLDRAIIAESAGSARRSLFHNAAPPTGIGSGLKSSYTEIALLNHEVSKSKRHIPIRDLTRRAGAALLELKPCWMMSPLAVAQYLDDPNLHFDLCVIDEASQMTPEHAVGALARSSQAVIVGDTNQLPPSSFFRKMVSEGDENEEDIVEDSILELANSAFRPSRRLRWHYRSRHSGLIAFSNHHVYDDDLIVFPSAAEGLSNMGVSLVAVDGSYRAGTNSAEADVMTNAVLRFMHEHPGRSLGVVTLNQKQRDLVEEKIDHALNHDARALAYVRKWERDRDGLESFFVKNLENVQGDERDVIFIGTVYGPDSQTGRVYQRFGPINGVAGKRRLNVLFSRAKKQIVTFSSMSAADISAQADTNPGANMLKRWLDYSKTNRFETGEILDREPDSDFEYHIAEQIRALGCEAVPQVGVGGFRIDIGVKHPQWPHGFLLGVECDGANYRSAKSARDRDRLRQEVLEGLGWTLHRVWSTHWFDDPATEVHKLRVQIEQRLREVQSTDGATSADNATTFKDAVAEELAPELAPLMPTTTNLANRVDADQVAIGSRIRLRFLDGNREVHEGTIAEDGDGPTHIPANSPLGVAIIGAEVGDVVPLLVDSRIRRFEVVAVWTRT
ncbi:DUF4011 domain-containing protein [Stackebrandtia nassauensis]|nr:DUF4011 domain-containing protein [Stackebrandtia nassauensis]